MNLVGTAALLTGDNPIEQKMHSSDITVVADAVHTTVVNFYNLSLSQITPFIMNHKLNPRVGYQRDMNAMGMGKGKVLVLMRVDTASWVESNQIGSDAIAWTRLRCQCKSFSCLIIMLGNIFHRRYQC
jgi:hypothetical protein